MGLQDGAKLAQNRKKSGLGVVWVWFLSDLKLDIFLKWRLGGLQARFWRPQASLLEGFGTPKLAQDNPKAPKFPATCFLKLRFLAFKFKRQKHRIWHAPSSKGLAKVGRRRCPPLGAFNGIRPVATDSMIFGAFWALLTPLGAPLGRFLGASWASLGLKLAF